MVRKSSIADAENFKKDPDILEVMAMSDAEVDAEFAEAKVDLDQLMESLRVRLHAHSHEEVVADAASDLSMMPPATRLLVPTTQPTAPQRGFLFLPWSGTHRLADRLREHVSVRHRRIYVQEGFIEIAAAVDAVGDRVHRDLDCFWPVAEAMEEAAAEVAGDDELHAEFAGCIGALSARSPVPVKGLIIHSLSEVFDRGERGRILATRCYDEILRHDHAAEVRLLIYCAAELHLPLGEALRRQLQTPLDRAMQSLHDDVNAAYHDARLNLREMRRATAEEHYFELPTVARLFDHQSRDATSSILSMYALGQVFHRAMRLILRYPIERQFAVRHVFARHLLTQFGEESTAHFLTAEMFESIRDRYPRFAASMMVELVHKAGPRGRQSLFVCLAEGYEAYFSGVAQRQVPQFVLGAGKPRFIAPGYPLDLFGQLICGSPVAEELREPMEWANRRLARWQDAIHGVPVTPPKRFREQRNIVPGEEGGLSRAVAECLTHAPRLHITPDT
jgi:hypothetical protein